MVDDNKKSIFPIITKLMDENVDEVSQLESSYQSLANEILKDLPKTLDEGAYIDNATVIRRMSNTLEMNEVLVKIPRLIGKHLIAIYSKGTKLKKVVSTVVDNTELLDGNNNFPHLVLPTTNGDSHKLYALTYCDKLVELSIDEYRLINTQLYKVGVEGRSLIKALISYHAMKYEHEAYLLMPTYVAESNVFYELLQDKIDEHVIIPHKELNLYQVRKFQNQKNIYFLGSEETFKELKGKTKFPEVIFADTEDALYSLLEGWNLFTLNTMLSAEVERILLDVRLFYVHRIGELQKKLERFNKDIVSVSDEELKEEIQGYRNKLRDYVANLQGKSNDFDKAYNTIIKNVDSFEKSLFNIFDYAEGGGNFNTSNYTLVLLRVFFKHVLGNFLVEAHNDIQKLRKVGYVYLEVCEILAKYKEGYFLTVDEMEYIKSLPSDSYQIAKMQVMLSSKVNFTQKQIQQVVPYLDPIETGEENYYFGLYLLEQNKYKAAANKFLEAIELDYNRAENRLMELYHMDPNLIDLETLAMYLIPEASYLLAREVEDTKARKADVYYKIAASKEYQDAIAHLADKLYWEYIRLSYRECKDSEIQDSIYNVINLYLYLMKKRRNEEYQLRIGLLYHKVEDYGRAYELLSSLSHEEAIYTCARMLEYGNGVSKNLSAAKNLYAKISKYKDAHKRWTTIDNAEREKARKTTYSESRSYERSYSSSSSGSSSSGCFAITATCAAPEKDRSWTDLSKLIKFRNAFVRMEGAESVAEYYRLGPMIVDSINAEEQPKEMYQNLWNTYIEPSLTSFFEGKLDDVKRIYVNMCKMLCEKYDIPVEDHILRKYEAGKYKKTQD